jgi:hypothetical protein
MCSHKTYTSVNIVFSCCNIGIILHMIYSALHTTFNISQAM